MWRAHPCLTFNNCSADLLPVLSSVFWSPDKSRDPGPPAVFNSSVLQGCGSVSLFSRQQSSRISGEFIQSKGCTLNFDLMFLMTSPPSHLEVAERLVLSSLLPWPSFCPLACCLSPSHPFLPPSFSSSVPALLNPASLSFISAPLLPSCSLGLRGGATGGCGQPLFSPSWVC